MTTARSFRLFSDFNCPFCYAFHERLDDMHLLARCDWQGVQHAPHLPRPMNAWHGNLGAELRHEVAVVRRLSPELTLELPVGKPNTGPAIAFAAECLNRDLDSGMMLVRAIYRAFWIDGRDISNPDVLAELAGSPPSREGSASAPRIVGQWASAWEATSQYSVPLIVAQTGEQLVGCQPTEAITRFFSGHEGR